MTLNREEHEDDPCNISLLYGSDYTYFLPRKTLNEWMLGKAFEHSFEYSLQEQKHLQEDIRDIYEKVCSDQEANIPSEVPQVIITAGPPGAGKTMLVAEHLSQDNSQKVIYLSSSDLCLKNQQRTYQLDMQNSDQSLEMRRHVFCKWKPGAVAAKHIILGHLIHDRKSLYLGATCIEPFTKDLLHFLKQQKYQIKILYVAASDQIRWSSIQERNKTFAHSNSHTEQNVIKKGIDFAQQLPILLLYADEIFFYHREKVRESAKLVALWTKRISPSDNLDTLHIFLSNEYRMVKLLHNTSIQSLLRSDLLWENVVELKSKLVFC